MMVLADYHVTIVFSVVIFSSCAPRFGELNDTNQKVAVKCKDLKFDPDYSVSILLRHVNVISDCEVLYV